MTEIDIKYLWGFLLVLAVLLAFVVPAYKTYQQFNRKNAKCPSCGGEIWVNPREVDGSVECPLCKSTILLERWVRKEPYRPLGELTTGVTLLALRAEGEENSKFIEVVNGSERTATLGGWGGFIIGYKD